MYRQPITSSVPGRSTVNVKPVRSAKSRACRSRSRRFSSSDIPSTGGHPPDSNPGVARMCAMLDVHAAWSDALCSGPSGTRCSSGSSSSRGGSNSSGTNGSAVTAREATATSAAGASETVLVGEDDCLRAASEVELGEDVGDVLLDGAGLEHELAGDVGVGEAAGHE